MNDKYYLYADTITGNVFVVCASGKEQADEIAWAHYDDPIFQHEISEEEAEDLDGEVL